MIWKRALAVERPADHPEAIAVSWLAQNLTTFFQILPGFITAAIFYTLTAHPKSTEFERVVQALIFTTILKVLLLPIRLVLLAAGRWFALANWTPDIELAWMVVLALPLGLAFAKMANSDYGHRLARGRGLTTRTSYPSEWYGTFVREGQRWIILHLKQDRRLYGWPEEWPDQADKGHFVIDQPEWVMADSVRVPIHQTIRFLVPASEVERVEFLANSEEMTHTEAETKTLQEPLLKLHRSQIDGSQAADASPQPAAVADSNHQT